MWLSIKRRHHAPNDSSLHWETVSTVKKRFGLFIIALTLVILGIIFTLAYRINLELERVVTEQFNDQQLVLAQKIASDIHLHFSFLNTALLSFSHKWAATAAEGTETFSIPALLDFIKNWGVLGISPVQPAQKFPLIYLESGWKRLEELGLPPESLSCVGHFKKDHPVCLSLTLQPQIGPFASRWLMTMSVPALFPPAVEQNGPTSAEPPFLVFLLDAQSIARRYAEGVRSGKTGYAWVIDHKGYFMYHVENDFNGQNSLTIRHARNPKISYERINSLVENRLLKGEEGTDWYLSGWHWEVIRQMRKLFAFSPIFLYPKEDDPLHVWSVGLAAPDTEVYGLIKPIVLRQLLIVGLFFGLAIITFAAFLFISLRWSETLRREVDKKTEHLRHSESELRQERDRVKKNMDQLVLTQEKLVISERFAAIGEAAAHLTHEIKNPLMLIGGFAHQILRTLPDDDQRREKLRIITCEAKRLEAMLMEVRDFTRPPQPKKTDANVNETVRDVVGLFQEYFQAQHIRLDLQLASDLSPCRFDPNQIKQVLLNLVKNAIEAMPKGGTLTIGSQTENSYLHVMVADTGEGIAPDKMKKLFHPFFTTKQKGTGLGLAVSYKIIQDHGGEILAESREGEGSRFIFTLPLA